MKLRYRGAEYDYEPTPVDMAETGITGQYRGRTFNFAYPRHIPVPQPTGDYKYRGVTYHRTANGTIEPVSAPVAAPATPAVQTPTGVTYRSVAASRHALMQEVAGKHRENIHRRLQHRLEVARAKGDQLLINELEREMQYTAR
ncbi:DUF4278 domain-containing protein [Oscillatoria sp. FACHB-1407]|uniref:arginine synthesis PII-interacting regulator PirA n=1 Tax=Oscillatoria sp. FACHB-1407 TaxID=2692847 RepID=UPI0016857041|nr:DUF4278 domain-containing protein [Oscillatoria sp. FACHB-1407]MBD2461573.1 DUF4278 domain-containing protein [Oscillatoria sp. FACHB-1407]